ncbi:alpha/beta fold hydrolase [Leifsonia sp. NPDC058248]|uniref:alpha/beta fold hydrolase n=1 Tax=Leifsonia sp. NPDC058248 TaxID=3346402 RepID=UPI0036D9B614
MTHLMLPGAGGAGWIWHLVVNELQQRGHEAIAVDFEVGGDNGLTEYTEAVIAAAGDRSDIVLVAQSMGAFTVALAAPRLPVTGLVFLNAMIPEPGETAGEWWEATGHADAIRESDHAAGRDPDAEFDLDTYFTHDLTPEIREGLLHVGGSESEAAFATPCAFDAWPDVPTRVIAGRDDRFFPLGFQRRVAAERLGLPVDEVDGGHLAALSHPEQVAELVLAPGRRRDPAQAILER